MVQTVVMPVVVTVLIIQGEHEHDSPPLSFFHPRSRGNVATNDNDLACQWTCHIVQMVTTDVVVTIQVSDSPLPHSVFHARDRGRITVDPPTSAASPLPTTTSPNHHSTHTNNQQQPTHNKTTCPRTNVSANVRTWNAHERKRSPVYESNRPRTTTTTHVQKRRPAHV